MAAQWPPRSPHEALLSTPSGREKYRQQQLQHRQQRSISPTSPSSRIRSARSIHALSAASLSRAVAADDVLFDGDLLDEDAEGDDDEDNEDDEETLQLKLQAIQTRLRLKKLQAAKAAAQAQRRNNAATASMVDLAATTARNSTAAVASSNISAGVPLQSKLAAARDRMEAAQNNSNAVQVPASPVRRTTTMSGHGQQESSPKRVLLGIDKGLKGADVSLKRAPSRRTVNGGQSQGTGTGKGLGAAGAPLTRSKSVMDFGSSRQPQQQQHQQQHQREEEEAARRPMSFNERLASARAEEVAKKERRERIQRARSTAFDVRREEMEEYKSHAAEVPDQPVEKPQEFTREQVLASVRGRSVRGSGTGNGTHSQRSSVSSRSEVTEEGPGFEPYSGLFLTKRILPHNVLARAVSGKKIYLIKDLLRVVKSPDWSLPDEETDIVLFAILASKSDPRSHKTADGRVQQDRGKYMVLTLVDLTYEVELFLFNSGFDRFWKLTPGTVLAILNPGILPPPPGREATNRFGLVINSDADTILEIGTARDLGYCKSLRKDGTYCNAWVNSKRTEHCEFHTNEAVRKARSSRIELATSAGFGGSDSKHRLNSHAVYLRDKQAEQKEKEHRATLGKYDRFTQSQYVISTAARAAIDPEDERVTGIAERREREEALKRRLAQREKERDIARKLSEMGGGAGKEYMSRAAAAAAVTGSNHSKSFSGGSFSASFRSDHTSSSFTSNGGGERQTASLSFSLPSSSFEQPSSSQGQLPRKWDARALGLIGRRQGDGSRPEDVKVDLSRAPAPSSTVSSSSATGTSSSAFMEAAAANKRKRPESSASSTTTTSTGLGWGAALKEKLGRMKEGEGLHTTTRAATTATAKTTKTSASHNSSSNGSGNGNNSYPPPKSSSNSTSTTAKPTTTTKVVSIGNNRNITPPLLPAHKFRGDKSPVRKKTRFVTDKGIREAGRESLGSQLLSKRIQAQVQMGMMADEDDNDDDEDGLIIVR